jgi:hypothetical protein
MLKNLCATVFFVIEVGKGQFYPKDSSPQGTFILFVDFLITVWMQKANVYI